MSESEAVFSVSLFDSSLEKSSTEVDSLLSGLVSMSESLHLGDFSSFDSSFPSSEL